MRTIEVRNGSAAKVLEIETMNPARAIVHWPLAGQYELDLQTGELMHSMLPVNGLFSVDPESGRLRGTRYCVARRDLERFDLLAVGGAVRLVHDQSPVVWARIRDILRGDTLQLHLRTEHGSPMLGWSFRTGWRASQESIAALKRWPEWRQSEPVAAAR